MSIPPSLSEMRSGLFFYGEKKHIRHTEESCELYLIFENDEGSGQFTVVFSVGAHQDDVSVGGSDYSLDVFKMLERESKNTDDRGWHIHPETRIFGEEW